MPLAASSKNRISLVCPAAGFTESIGVATVVPSKVKLEDPEAMLLAFL